MSSLLRWILIWAVTQGLGVEELHARTARYRMTWSDDPATTATIGFQSVSGTDLRLYYGRSPGGQNPSAYTFSARPARTVISHGMNNVFVRLIRLQPATTYYFIVVDSEGSSRQMSFETTPNTPAAPLSVIAGGDSRNNRSVNQATNRIVAKLRPHFVLFGGDMTTTDGSIEWQQWLDDWQLTTGQDGRLTPILPARGNHEETNATIFNLFDVSNREVYYHLTFGGGLLSTYTLNTMIARAGNQAAWLDRTLATDRSRWKIAQYHQAMRPHVARKPENEDMVVHWATRFTRYGVDLVIESDGHCVKQTWPIRPSREPGSSQQFIRDDVRGTVYVGEGCWGAPLRPADDPKPWTQASGSFNQVKWLWISERDLQVRTIVVDRSQPRDPVAAGDRFRSPAGMYYWETAQGDVLVLRPRTRQVGLSDQVVPPTPVQMRSSDPVPTLVRDAQGRVTVQFTLPAAGPVEVLVVGPDRTMRHRRTLAARGPGPYTEQLDLPPLNGRNLELVLKGPTGVVAKFRLQ